MLFLFGVLRLFLNIVLLAEALNTAGGIYQLLLARKEGVAGRTNFNLNILNGGTGLDYISAGAGYLG